MDYTAVLSRLTGFFSGTNGVLLVAAIGVAGIVGVHFYRMRFARTQFDQKNKSYRNVVITPYQGEEGRDPSIAMTPNFSSNEEKLQS